MEVRDLYGVDERAGRLYFSATERTATGEDLYRIRLDGSGLERLSTAAGTHDAQFSTDFGYYLDRKLDEAR